MGGSGDGGKVGEESGESPLRLNSLPKNFLAPGVFLGVVAAEFGVGVTGAGVRWCSDVPSEVSDRAEDVGVRGGSGVRCGCPASTLARGKCSSGREECGAFGEWPARGAGLPPSPHTSTGSRTARPMTSSPRFWNFATFASVPASTMTFVRTLCACRL